MWCSEPRKNSLSSTSVLSDKSAVLCSWSAWQHSIKEDKLGSLLKCSHTFDLFFVLLPVHFSKKETSPMLQNWSKHILLPHNPRYNSVTCAHAVKKDEWRAKPYGMEKMYSKKKSKSARKDKTKTFKSIWLWKQQHWFFTNDRVLVNSFNTKALYDGDLNREETDSEDTDVWPCSGAYVMVCFSAFNCSAPFQPGISKGNMSLQCNLLWHPFWHSWDYENVLWALSESVVMALPVWSPWSQSY